MTGAEAEIGISEGVKSGIAEVWEGACRIG